MHIVNLTPHALTLMDAEGNVLTAIPASGTVARVEMEATPAGNVVPLRG